MAVSDKDILDRLDRIEALLGRLMVPVEAEEARQLLSCTDDQRKAHNRGVLSRARARQKQGRVKG